MTKNIIKKSNKSYQVKKQINKEIYYFGCYPTEETAIRVRDEMEAVSWDKSKYQSIRNKLREEGIKL